MTKIIPVITAAALVSLSSAQDRQITLPEGVLDKIADTLPERSNAGASFLSSAYSPNIEFSGDAHVWVTFVHEGAGYRNTLGYFTYQTDGVTGAITILSSNLLIPNASFAPQGGSQAGDVYDLRNAAGQVRLFETGEKLGFFMIADGWRTEARVQNFDANAVEIPSSDGKVNSQFGRGCYTSLPELNPEFAGSDEGVAQHIAIISFDAVAGFNDDKPYLVCGFEDLDRRRWSDDDFNDLIFMVHSDPVEAINTSEFWAYSNGDADSDGVNDTDDHYPNDPTRATTVRMPDSGRRTLGFEDLYPILGDADYNDVVIGYHYEIVKNARGGIVDMMGEYHLLARGATIDHEFGVRIPSIPAAMEGTVSIELAVSQEGVGPVIEQGGDLRVNVLNDNRFTVFPSTQAALPAGEDEFTNVRGVVDRPAAAARLVIHFDTPIREEVLGTLPFDPFLRFERFGLMADIHLPGNDGFAERHIWFPEEVGDESFLDDNGYPWVLEVPEDWRFPLERKRIWNGYSQFNSWAGSGGALAPNWYLYPRTTGGWVSPPLPDLIQRRDWTVDLPR